MADEVIGVPMQHQIPAGAFGPEPVTLDVRAYLVPHANGLVLVDTGMDASGADLDAAVARAGAGWADVSDIVISHGHPDHVGALEHVRSVAPRAVVRADPAEGVAGAEPFGHGERIGTLRAFGTPGHTPGHLSLVDEERGVLLVGDCLGVVDGRLARAPEIFTADAEEAERSLARLLDLRGTRMLFAHGPELADPWSELDALLDG